MKKVLLIVLLMTSILTIFSCGSKNMASNENAENNVKSEVKEVSINSPVLKCYNGNFVGSESNGVMSFKGIPYAKPPIGNRRWKAPEPVDESHESFDATTFGKSCLQPIADSEEASKNIQGEDCLTLNIWAKDIKEKKKPIMFFIHGGAYCYGGTSDSLYNGECIVKEHPDVVVVTCNYRVNFLGYMDFSGVPGGENYKESGYLGVLDLIEGLKWVKKNAEVFGGDPDNITIFGESAGGGMVTILMVVKEAEGLFNRVIAESGSLNFTFSKEEFDKQAPAKLLMKVTGAKNMDDLIAIPEDKLKEYMLKEDENGKSVGHLHYMPYRGNDSIIPLDPYESLTNGMSKDIDLIIGTNIDETRYFIDACTEPSINEYPKEEQEEAGELKQFIYSQTLGKAAFNRIKNVLKTDEEKDKFDSFINLMSGFKDKEIEFVGNRNIGMHSDEEKDFIIEVNDMLKHYQNRWIYAEIGNEIGFRLPAIEVAYRHATAGETGKTYMYLFDKKSTLNKWTGSCHAAELSYVFHNLENEHFTGKVDKKLADKVCTAWTNFAKNGDPTSKEMNWPEYTKENRETLFIRDDCTSEIVNDPKKQERELLEFTNKYYFK